MYEKDKVNNQCFTPAIFNKQYTKIQQKFELEVQTNKIRNRFKQTNPFKSEYCKTNTSNM